MGSQQIQGAYNGWDHAHATFYGDIKGGQTMSKWIHSISFHYVGANQLGWNLEGSNIRNSTPC